MTMMMMMNQHSDKLALTIAETNWIFAHFFDSTYWMWRSLHSNSMTFTLQTFLADSKFIKFFYVPLSNRNLRSTRSAPHVYTHRPPVNLTFSEMLKVIVFVGCVNKSKFFNLGFSQHNFHYSKNDRYSLHFIWYTVQYMSKLLTWSNSHSNGFVLWNLRSTIANCSRLRHTPTTCRSTYLLTIYFPL